MTSFQWGAISGPLERRQSFSLVPASLPQKDVDALVSFLQVTNASFLVRTKNPFVLDNPDRYPLGGSHALW